jgi:PST family polysaccharide transporter
MTIQHQAILRRSMRFTALAWIEISAIAVGIATAITLAWAGAGYWALVSAPIARSVFNCIAVFFSSGWVPGWPKWAFGVWGILRFGQALVGFNVVNYFARNLDNILIGKFWGAAALGLYSKAYSFLLLPIRQISGPLASIAVPALCSLQSKPARFRNYYLKALFLLCTVTTPIAVALMVLAEEVIDILFGSHWARAAVILRFLLMSALVQPLCNTSGWLYVASGNSGKLFKRGTIGATFLVVSFFVGLPYGPEGVAISYSVAMLIWAYPCMHLATDCTPVRTDDVFRVVFQCMLATVPGTAWLIIIRHIFHETLARWAWLSAAIMGMGLLQWLMVTMVLRKKELVIDVIRQIALKRT